jgi:hypothetical protein
MTPHHFSVPQVREIVQTPILVPPSAERPATQRELVAASLLLCPPVTGSSKKA